MLNVINSPVIDMASNAVPVEEVPKAKTNFVTNFVNNYVPDNEQTYNFAIPIIGFASSCISFGMFMTFIYYVKNGNVYYSMYGYGYMVLAGACAIELHYGLRNRNRKQYFFWIIVKMIEMVLILIAVIDAFVRRNDRLDFAIIGTVLIVTKIVLLYYILKRARSKRNRIVIPEENMYDLPRSPTQTTIYVNEVY